MFPQATLKPVAALLVAVLLISQCLFIGSVLLIPKPAKAWTITNVTLMDVWQAVEKVLVGIAKQLALRVAERFISRFVNKLVEKYKIRNYLYYDQVLTNYYLSNFIRDKIDDPNLRQVYSLLEAGFITGAPTGTTGQPDARTALIPRIKRAINDYYQDHYGVATNTLLRPPNDLPTSSYFNALMSYSFYNPGYVERNLTGQFGEFQSSSTTAAQLEIIVGNGIKAGRFIGGTCRGGTNTGTDPNSSPQACSAAGGTWQPSALDQARSFIDNPTSFIEGHINGFIKRRIDSSYDPNNFWAQIGAALGNFLFDQFALNKNTGTLNEDPRGYNPSNGPGLGVPIDIDGDGVPDAYDIDEPPDGKADICIFGGTPPDNCRGSRESQNGPPGGGLGGKTICALDEMSVDVIFHATEGPAIIDGIGQPYDRLSVHVSDFPSDADDPRPTGPDLVDDDAFHVPTVAGMRDFTNVFMRAEGGAGAYVTSQPTERQASDAAGVKRHTKIPDSFVVDSMEPGESVKQIDLSGWEGSADLVIGGFFRDTNSGDGRAEVCTPRSNIQGGVFISIEPPR